MEQKEYFLRQQLKSINQQLGREEGSPEKTKLREKAQTKKWSKETQSVFEKEMEPDTLTRMAEHARRHPGKVPLVLCVMTKSGKAVFINTSSEFSVNVTPAFIEGVEAILGRGRYNIKPSTDVPVSRPRWSGKRKEVAPE